MRLRTFAPFSVAICLCQTALGEIPFPQGVASGDVTARAAACWTRLAAPGPVALDIATDEAFTSIVFTANATASADADLTIKLIAEPLAAATRYRFRFRRTDTNDTSPAGTFVTAPAPDDARAFRFVYSGDSNAAMQPFRLLDFAVAEQPDFWFWAGDTIYSDQPAGGLDPAVDLPGYHAKHRQNRDDPHLQQLLAASPVWVQWDDHEVGNDYDGGDPEPQFTPQRIADAYRAFFDYMPIRPQDQPSDPWRTYRSFSYGSLAEFFMLDCRQYRSRDAACDSGGLDPYAFILPTLDIAAILRIHDPSRTMLGSNQLAWLKQGLLESTATWKFVLTSMPLTSLLVYPFDRWDGYAAERYELLRYIDMNHVTGVVFLAADIHGNAYNPNVTHFLRTSLWEPFSPGFAVPEFITGPIATSTTQQELASVAAAILGQPPADTEASLPFQLGLVYAKQQVVCRNALRFVDINHYAYLVVDVAPDAITLTHRGIPPDPAATAPTLETLNVATLREGGCAPGLPLLWPFAFAALTAPARRVIRRRSLCQFRRVAD